MTDVELIKDRLLGKNLLGVMSLNKEEYNIGDWDNAVALYVGTPDKHDCYILRSENQDYSCYDEWIIEKSNSVIERDSRYKTIGAKILDVIEHPYDSEKWQSGDDYIQFTIKTKTKELTFGHVWVDCHYPNSIWDVI